MLRNICMGKARDIKPSARGILSCPPPRLPPMVATWILLVLSLFGFWVPGEECEVLLTAIPCAGAPSCAQPLKTTLIPSATLMFWLQPHLYGEYGAPKMSDIRHLASYQTFTLE